MDVQSLRYFAAVYEAGTLTNAALRCHVSQPSVSIALRRLERHIGEALFVRGREGMTPTAAAERLYPRVRHILDEISGLKSDTTEPTEHPLVVHIAPTLTVERGATLIGSLTSAGIDVRVVREINEADIRIGKKTAGSPDSFIPLWRQRFMLILPQSHPLVGDDDVQLRDLDGLGLIARCRCELGGMLPLAGIRPRIVAVVDSEEWAFALTRTGVGIALAPVDDSFDQPGLVARRVAGVNATREIGASFEKRRSAEPVMRKAIDILRLAAR